MYNKYDITKSRKSLIVFILAFAILGAYFIFMSSAATPVVASLQAEQMVLPKSASIINDSSASNGKAVELTQQSSIHGSVSLPSQATSIGVVAKATQCKGSWPRLRVNVDGQTVMAYTAVSSSWKTFNVSSLNLATGPHKLTISAENLGVNHCARPMYVDVTNFYGPDVVTPTPSVTISATPASVTAGQASTITWSSSNATSCTASGSWNGSEPVQGTISTGALNQNATYSLSCSGTGGNANGSTSVTVSQGVGSGCTKTESSLTNINSDLSNPGAVVCLTSGNYGALAISASPSANSTLESAPGSTANFTDTINVYGSHITLANMKTQSVVIGNFDETPGRPNAAYVTLNNLTGRNFEIDSASNIMVNGGSWGPASACGGPYGGNNNSIREPVPGVAPTSILIENTVIHDVQSYNLTNCHIEGLAIFAGTGVTVSNSRFYGNSIYDIFIQANSGGSPKSVTIADNWLADAIDNSGANGHPVGYHNGIAFGSEIASGLTISGNHMNGIININDDGSISNYTDTTIQYNVGKMSYPNYPCGSVLKGVAFTKNIWQNDTCGTGDVDLNGAGMPYVKASDDSSMNYTLTGSYANWPN